MHYPAIEEYAVIGDCRCLGLVSRAGSLDWLCLPRFDSPPMFSAVLDAQKGGRFSIAPAGEAETERHYIDNTNILRTTFTTATGRFRLTDFMPVGSRQEYRQALCPERQLLRIGECLEGEVEVVADCRPRPQFGRRSVLFKRRGRLGYCYEDKGHFVNLLSDMPLELSSDKGSCRGRMQMGKGDTCGFSLTHTERNTAVIPPVDKAYRDQLLAKSRKWWQEWASGCTYQGRYKKEVMRSLLALKLLTYAPSGAVVAAPTCSLPEHIGGSRNWDYRYCWLRDASMSLRAFVFLGYTEEAEAFLSWLLHSTKLSRPQLRVLYSIYGETKLTERVVDHLDGYRSSRPVRIGNGASDQEQLDVYGEVIQGAYDVSRVKPSFDWSTRRMLRSLGQVVCRKWRQTDPGIWERRGEPKHITHSKVMCWVALDRLLSMHENGVLKVPVQRFRQERDAIREAIEKEGYNEDMQCYTSTFSSKEVDLSLMLLPKYGYVEAGEARMRTTFAELNRRLRKNGHYYRFPYGYDGIEESEGTFAIGIFLAAALLAQRGDIDEARRVFEHGLQSANDVGLYSEELDPESGAALGNFPQAYTHVGLIDAAMILDQYAQEHTEQVSAGKKQKEGVR